MTYEQGFMIISLLLFLAGDNIAEDRGYLEFPLIFGSLAFLGVAIAASLSNI